VNSALLPSTKLAKLKIDSCSPLQSSAWNYNKLKSEFKLSLFQIKLISVARRVVLPNPTNHPWIRHCSFTGAALPTVLVFTPLWPVLVRQAHMESPLWQYCQWYHRSQANGVIGGDQGDFSCRTSPKHDTGQDLMKAHPLRLATMT